MRQLIMILMYALSCVALAQPPLCTGPGRPPGACFIYFEPGMYMLWAPTPDGAVAVFPLDEKYFAIQKPNGKIQTLIVEQGAWVAYCTPSMLEDRTCPAPLLIRLI